MLLGDYTVININIISTTFIVVDLGEMIVCGWLAESLEVFINAASLIVC
jgi:hypothetical protein